MGHISVAKGWNSRVICAWLGEVCYKQWLETEFPEDELVLLAHAMYLASVGTRIVAVLILHFFDFFKVRIDPDLLQLDRLIRGPTFPCTPLYVSERPDSCHLVAYCIDIIVETPKLQP